MAKETFDDYISARENDIAEWIAKNYGEKIFDFGDFKNVFNASEIADNFNTGHTPITETGLITLWENQATRRCVKDNVPETDFEKMYPERREEREIRRKKAIAKEKPISYARVRISSHTKAKKEYHKDIRKGKAYFWQTKETNYLRILKAKARAKKLNPKDVVEAYNKRFKDIKRPSSSISSKYYRLR